MGLFCMLGLVLRWGMCEMVGVGSWISALEIFKNCCWLISSYSQDHCAELYAWKTGYKKTPSHKWERVWLFK